MKTTVGEIRKLISERIRSQTFDWDTFINVASTGNRLGEKCVNAIKYANGKLQKVGASGRVAYILTSKTVLKIANGEGSVEQNEAETNISTASASDIIAKTLKHSPDYVWIVSELVRPIKDENEFFTLSGGVNIAELSWVGNATKQIYAQAKNNEFLQSLQNFLKSSKIIVEDIDRIDQWGVAPDGRLVLLDYGLM